MVASCCQSNSDLPVINSRNISNFKFQIPNGRCLILATFVIGMSFVDMIYAVWRTEFLASVAESTGYFNNAGIQLYCMNISIRHFKWIRHGLDILKIMMIMYRHLLLILSVYYSAQLVSDFGKSSVICSKLLTKRKYGLEESWIILEEWKKLTSVFESINRAHGFYLLLFFPAAIVFVITSICTQFIQALPTPLGIRVAHMFPGIWFISRLMILMELGHALDEAVSIILVLLEYF